MGTIVVKLGGSLLEDATLRAEALGAIADEFKSGGELVVVHGGGKRIDATLAGLGIEKKTHRGLRITDARTLEVVIATLAGVVNKMLVSELHGAGVAAAGISGSDGETILAELHPPIDGVDLGFVGKVTSSNPTLINAIAATGFLPVVGSVAVGPGASLLNVNADAAAAAVAAALGAERLVFLTDVEGLLDQSGSVVSSLDVAGIERMLGSAFVTGGMQPKLRASLEALQGGVGEVVIAGPARHRAALHGGTGGTHLVAA